MSLELAFIATTFLLTLVVVPSFDLWTRLQVCRCLKQLPVGRTWVRRLRDIAIAWFGVIILAAMIWIAISIRTFPRVMEVMPITGSWNPGEASVSTPSPDIRGFFWSTTRFWENN